MSQTSKTVLILVIIAVLVVIIALAVGGRDAGEINQDGISEVDETTEVSEGSETTENTIRYTANGFEPATLTIEAGETVTWTNDSTGGMWVASDVHPTHEVLPEFDQRAPGDTYTFTFEEAGEWNFHNHLDSGHVGTVRVE